MFPETDICGIAAPHLALLTYLEGCIKRLSKGLRLYLKEPEVITLFQKLYSI